MPSRVAVIGAGAWGTTLARHIGRNGSSVRLWAYEPDVVESIRTRNENVPYLPGVRLSASIIPTASLGEALEDADWVLFAVPSHVARPVFTQLTPCLHKPVPLVLATKGIEEGSLCLMTEVAMQTVSSIDRRDLAVLSGPSFAAEVCAGLPTAVTVAGDDPRLLQDIGAALMTPLFRVYTCGDAVGVQLGGALKNVVAIAAGVVDGLGLGHNARAALITRGLAEMIRLGTAMGADARTFYGLSGVGDLVLTCTGALSRNHRVGLEVARGQVPEMGATGMRAVAEGVRTSRAAMGLARRHRVEMPIVQAVYEVLFEGKACRQAVTELMERAARNEMEPTGL